MRWEYVDQRINLSHLHCVIFKLRIDDDDDDDDDNDDDDLKVLVNDTDFSKVVIIDIIAN